MTAVITWSCNLCGNREAVPIPQLKAFDDAHVCRVADVIGLAVAILATTPSPISEAVCRWLKACQEQARLMGPSGDFDFCDEPGSVRCALDVARTVIAEEGL